MSDVKFMADMIYDDVVHITPERYKEFTKAEAQVKELQAQVDRVTDAIKNSCVTFWDGQKMVDVKYLEQALRSKSHE